MTRSILSQLAELITNIETMNLEDLNAQDKELVLMCIEAMKNAETERAQSRVDLLENIVSFITREASMRLQQTLTQSPQTGEERTTLQ